MVAMEKISEMAAMEEISEMTATENGGNGTDFWNDGDGKWWQWNRFLKWWKRFDKCELSLFSSDPVCASLDLFFCILEWAEVQQRED